MTDQQSRSAGVAADRRRRLREAAITVIAERGLSRASLSHIAREAGVSKAAVLYHVDHRDALVADAVEEVLRQYAERVRTAVDAAPDARAGLFSYVEESLRYLWSRADLLAVVIAAAAADGTGSVPSTHGRDRDLARLIEAGVQAGRLETSDPLTTAVAINGALDALLVHGRWADDEERENLLGEAVSLVDRMITPRG